MNGWAQEQGAPGMGYIILGDGEGRGPLANNIGPEKVAALKELTGMGDGDAIFFSAGKPERRRSWLARPV